MLGSRRWSDHLLTRCWCGHRFRSRWRGGGRQAFGVSAFLRCSDEVQYSQCSDHRRGPAGCAQWTFAHRANRAHRNLEALASALRSEVPHVITLQGGMVGKSLAAALHQLKIIPSDESRVVVATGRFIGEGFDDARLDTLFLTMPVSWRGTIAQYAGRLHRLHADKSVVQVYDYVDLDVPMLARMFDKRCVGYEAVGYTLLLSASALPGWPQEVSLPLDPQWESDYATSVRRLIRDGVDTPLALLFVHATWPPPVDAEGLARARSASEAFIYRCFETLPALRGRFLLNPSLPISFDDRGH